MNGVHDGHGPRLRTSLGAYHGLVIILLQRLIWTIDWTKDG
jgi:hypothetical protein